jgi:flagellar basal body-associated protein FliL
MADEQANKAPAAPKGGAAAVLGIILPAILAAGGAFGGTKLAGGASAHASEPAHNDAPGPTEALEPFLVTIQDPQRPHVIKVTLAIELKLGAKPEHIKAFIPRIRDSTLGYFRSLSFEDASSPARFEQMRTDLLDRIVKLGVHDAEHVLITEFVAQ